MAKVTGKPLKPCPFCGGEPQIDRHGAHVIEVRCSSCGAIAHAGAPADVEQRWNKRQEPESVYALKLVIEGVYEALGAITPLRPRAVFEAVAKIQETLKPLLP